MEIRGDVTDGGRTTDDEQLKIELLSQWKLEAESRIVKEKPSEKRKRGKKTRKKKKDKKKKICTFARASLAASASAAIALCSITGSLASLLVIVFFISFNLILI